MRPERIRRQRTPGWRAPKGAVYVGRPTVWGNPFRVSERTHLWHRATTYPYDFYRDWFPVNTAEQATRLYRKWLLERDEYWLDQPPTPTLGEIRDALAGRDLMCWCPIGTPCHADVLLEIANASEGDRS